MKIILDKEEPFERSTVTSLKEFASNLGCKVVNMNLGLTHARNCLVFSWDKTTEVCGIPCITSDKDIDSVFTISK